MQKGRKLSIFISALPFLHIVWKKVIITKNPPPFLSINHKKTCKKKKGIDISAKIGYRYINDNINDNVKDGRVEKVETGVVFDIKEFAVYDGPGIRQTVFLKGCPLHCSWCHNPEGLSMQPQLMVSYASCQHCGRCREVCEHESCVACGKCIPVCPLHLRSISGEVLTSEELVSRIRRNSDYYARYGGGVTFSGGEPLLQAAFLLEVLEQLPDLHKAIETSGYCRPETFCKVTEKLDYIMMDLKLMEPKLHRKYTGVDNQVILQNAKQLCKGEKPFVIRIPVIPGVNDNEANFRATAQWLQGARMLQKVELLPYHKTAGAKYAMIGKSYEPLFDPEKRVWISGDIFQEYGIRSEIL